MRALPYIVSAAVYGVVFLIAGYICYKIGGSAGGLASFKSWLTRSNEVPWWFVVGALIGVAQHWLRVQRN
ncbi:hypothetical protein ACTOV4_16400 [Brucella sp. C7-11G]